MWQPKLCDRSQLVVNKHVKTAQRGGRGTWNSHDTFDRGQLHALPKALCDEIVEVCRQTVPVNQCDFTPETNHSKQHGGSSSESDDDDDDTLCV